MSTPIQEVPAVVLPAPFPTTADRVAGIYNAKAKAWADKEAEMAESLYSISLVTYNNAIAAQERAEAAEQIRVQTLGIKNAATAETGAIRDQAIAARDAAASYADAAQANASFKGAWVDLAGPLAPPATVYHKGAWWALLRALPNVAAAEPGVSDAWAAAGVRVLQLAYDQRDQLRTLTGPGLEFVLVDGLGLFAYAAGSTEPDDDESCFATAAGRWLLNCPHWDLVDAWQLPDTDLRDSRLDDIEARILTGTTVSSITSVASLAQVSFTGWVLGAAVGDRVIATPPDALRPRTAYFARVTADNTVTVYLNNPSASTETLATGTWGLAVIKP